MFDLGLPRRGFLARSAATLASLAAAGVMAPAGRALARERGSSADPDAWLDGLKGKHRCLFDAPSHAGGLPLVHMLNYITTYKSAYGAPATEVNAVGTFYGPPGATATMPLAWNDAMWAKYKIGELMQLTDPTTKAPAQRNMYDKPRAGDPVLFGGAMAAAGLANLRSMNATFLMCNNAFMLWVGFLAQQGRGAAAEIERDIRANLLPGVVTVPAMVIAIEKAQGRRVAYNRQ